MTAVFTGEEILDICKARLASGLMPDEAAPVVSDTRLLSEGQWYLAFAGDKFDGHDFLGDAFAAGALGAIVQERPNYPIGSQQFPLLAVEDTLAAYHALARNWRKRISPKVVGITGSSGKTTSKEMCASVFCNSRRCHYSVKNENNEFGVPKTLLAMPDDTQVAVIEMAMRGLTQIEALAKCALPNIGIITNAGTAHIELLGSRENIAKAKCELLEQMDKKRGLAILGSNAEHLLARARAVFDGRMLIFSEDEIEIIEVDTESSRFRLKDSPVIFKVRAHGMPLIADAWCAIVAGRELGLSDAEIADGLSFYQAIGGRGNKMTSLSGALIIDETYNANPDSVKAAVSALVDKNAYPQSKKIVVLGDLLELGAQAPDLLEELGTWLKSHPLHLLITVGSLARHIYVGAAGADFEVLHCQDMSVAEAELEKRSDQDSCVLVKGSRGARLDKLVLALSKKNG
ncbi:MAG: UDP-N-acetylmuramoyl-tripeptide--D-alanyl-D-alanine ligase [Candidatus Obscuribacterales bacterium]|nr:UDP-N-acetylmuramoyl-tripeptide--D-alanyl-D-alanine ligase [Candidatus Obscuribacterales bacterium]